MSFFCSKTSSRSILRTLARTTAHKQTTAFCSELKPDHMRNTYIYVYIVAILLEHKAYSLKSDTDYINYLQQGLLYLASNTYDLIVPVDSWACRRHLQQSQCVLDIALMPPQSQRHCPEHHRHTNPTIPTPELWFILTRPLIKIQAGRQVGGRGRGGKKTTPDLALGFALDIKLLDAKGQNTATLTPQHHGTQ
jgi:hypothetical protein